MEKYGEIKYFNVYGQEIAAPTVKTVDASVTPQSILQKAVDASGGVAAIAAIKDVQLKGSASLQGMTMSDTTGGDSSNAASQKNCHCKNSGN